MRLVHTKNTAEVTKTKHAIRVKVKLEMQEAALDMLRATNTSRQAAVKDMLSQRHVLTQNEKKKQEQKQAALKPKQIEEKCKKKDRWKEYAMFAIRRRVSSAALSKARTRLDK